jgi:hypothetical protein
LQRNLSLHLLAILAIATKSFVALTTDIDYCNERFIF